MEQKDYLLKEIEKIGTIISYIRQKILGGKESLSISIDKQMEETKELLLSEIGFDLDKFLALTNEESGQYLSAFKGFDVENTEQLADFIFQIGYTGKSGETKKYLEKALQLFELCRLNSKTYSLDRESKITAIKNSL